MSRRSNWKGPFVHPSILKHVKRAKQSGSRKPITTWQRGSTILPEFMGLDFNVHNGKKFILVNINDLRIGRKFGEFAPTRTYYGHGADKKAKRK